MKQDKQVLHTQGEENKLIRWFNDGFPPIDLNTHVGSVVGLIREIKELKAENNNSTKAIYNHANRVNLLETENKALKESNEQLLDALEKAAYGYATWAENEAFGEWDNENLKAIHSAIDNNPIK